jgi:cytoskeletal protein CcmA (bactofilin family)
MGTSYVRQSSMADGDTITAALFNDEFNRLLTAFSYASSSTTGHQHDGTAAEGGNIHTIGDQDFLNKIVADSTNNRWGFFVEVSSSAVEQIRIQDGAIVPVTDNDIDLGTSSLEFKDAYFDGTVTTDALVADTADINGGSVDGATLGTNSAITQAVIDNVNINGTTIGHTDDTDLITLADGVVTIAGELDATTLDISGNADIDGTLEADAYTVDGTALNEYIADTVGAMVGSNTETNITVTYEDGDNTLDFVIGTLNQDTTGTADNFTVSANNSTDETVYPIFVDGATGSQGAESDTGLTYNPSSGLLTISGELDAGSLDISGNADIDGTLEADAITVDGTALNEYIADTVGAMVGSNTESGITVAYQDGDNTLDFTVGTLNQDTTGTAAIATTVTITDNESTNENNAIIFTAGGDLDGGNLGLESDGDLIYNPSTGLLSSTGVTASGTITFGTLSDGTIGVTAWVDEDNMSSDSATLVPTQQSVKAYVDSQTSGSGTMSNFILEDDDGTEVTVSNAKEVKFIGSGITTNWTDTDNGTDGDPYDLTFTVDAAQTGITSLLATDIKIGEDDQTKIDFEDADKINFYAGNEKQLILEDGALYPGSDNIIDLGKSDNEFKDAFFDGTVTADAFAGPLTGDVTGNASGTAATVTGAAQSNITSLGTLTTLTVDNVIINGSTIGHTGDTDLMTVASGVLTVAGEVSMTTLDIGGTNVTATAAELNYSDGVTSAIQTQLDTKASTGKAIAMAMVFG